MTTKVASMLAILLLLTFAAGCRVSPMPTLTPMPTSDEKNATPEPEDTATLPEVEDVRNQEESGEAEESGNGLWLSIPSVESEGTLMRSEENAQGVRADTYFYDGLVAIVIERLLPGSGDTLESIVARTASWENVSEEEIATEVDDVTAGQLGHPSYRLFYTTGGNEDTRWNMDLWVMTGPWDFRVHVVIPIDYDEEYAEQVIHWFYEVELIN